MSWCIVSRIMTRKSLHVFSIEVVLVFHLCVKIPERNMMEGRFLWLSVSDFTCSVSRLSEEPNAIWWRKVASLQSESRHHHCVPFKGMAQ